jgi:hypothetical protein
MRAWSRLTRSAVLRPLAIARLTGVVATVHRTVGRRLPSDGHRVELSLIQVRAACAYPISTWRRPVTGRIPCPVADKTGIDLTAIVGASRLVTAERAILTRRIVRRAILVSGRTLNSCAVLTRAVRVTTLMTAARRCAITVLR